MEEPPAEKLASTQGEQLTELDDMPGEFVENVRAHLAIFRVISLLPEKAVLAYKWLIITSSTVQRHFYRIFKLGRRFGN